MAGPAELVARQVPLSLVMPAHNEEANIARAVTEWHDQVAARLPGTEIIVVDDASVDQTATELAALAARIPSLRVLSLVDNVGHGPATRRGLDAAQGAFVFQTDSDRQHSPEDFWPLWARRCDVDFAIGVREQRADGAVRRAVSTILRGLNGVIWGQWASDINCPFKLMRGDALRAVLARVPRDTFIPMVMIVLVARRLGYSVVECPVRHFPRRAGTASLQGLTRWLRVGSRCARELVRLRWSLGRRRPLHPRRVTEV